jgi:hypothetical protein
MSEGSGDGAVVDTPGFEWGRTDDSIWIRNDEGEYKRIEQEFFEALRDLAETDRTVDDLGEKMQEAVAALRTEGYITDDGEVTKVPTPSDIRLWPRLLVFLGVFCSLAWLAVTQLLPGAQNVDVTLLSPSGGVFAIQVVGLLLGLLFVHELGHYLAARPYFEPSMHPTLSGLGLPSMWVDTTDAWRCPRNIRVWISLAGSCFGFLATLALGLLYVFVFPDANVLAVAALVQFIRDILSLNPLVKGDGYWILVDGLGLVNLWQRGQEDLRSFTLSWPTIYMLLVSLCSLVMTIGILYILGTLLGVL